jgi:hypothetical protein
MLDCQVSPASEQFDPAVREDLTSFFAKALHSDHRQRFDNAEEMLRTWRRLFESVDRPVTETDHNGNVDFDRVAAIATEETPLSARGLSPRVLDALGRIGAQTVGELLSLPRIRLYRNQVLGQKIVKEIRDRAERIAQIFAERGAPLPPATLDESEQEEIQSDPRLLSVDFLARRVVPKWAEVEDRRIVSGLLGLEGDGGARGLHASVRLL